MTDRLCKIKNAPEAALFPQLAHLILCVMAFQGHERWDASVFPCFVTFLALFLNQLGFAYFRVVLSFHRLGLTVPCQLGAVLQVLEMFFEIAL